MHMMMKIQNKIRFIYRVMMPQRVMPSLYKNERTIGDCTHEPAGAAAHEALSGCGTDVDTYKSGGGPPAGFAEICSPHVGVSMRTTKYFHSSGSATTTSSRN